VTDAPTRWRPLRPGKGLRGLRAPWQRARLALGAALAAGILGATWPAWAHVAPATAALSEGAPRLADRLVASVKERLPATPASAALPSGAEQATWPTPSPTPGVLTSSEAPAGSDRPPAPTPSSEASRDPLTP
jgi:hypothetical protein